MPREDVRFGIVDIRFFGNRSKTIEMLDIRFFGSQSKTIEI